jgi:hypothetical protein
VYTNVLEIYDGNGSWRYRKRFADENIMQITFAANDNDIIVSSIGFDGGSWDVTATVRRFDTSTDTDALWTARLPDNTLPYAVHAAGNHVFVLCDNLLIVIDFNDGREIGRFGYTGNLIDFAFAESGEIACVILVNDFSAGSMNLIALDRAAEVTSIADMRLGASQVEIHSGGIYVLEPTVISIYSGTIFEHDSAIHEIIELNEEYFRFIHVGDEILLLGFNTVAKAGEDGEEELIE